MSTNTFKEQQEETRLFWQAIAEKTNCLVKLLFAVYEEGNKFKKRVHLNKDEPLHPKDVFALLKEENAWFKNKEVKKSVLWKFAEDQTYNVVIVDDIKEIKHFKSKDHFLLWETSPGKFQAAFLLDRYLNDEEIKKIQRVLNELYKGDKGCLGASHLIKMPGFYNTKYLNDPPYIKLLHIGRGILSAEQVLRYYEYNIKPKEYKPKKDLKSLPKLMTYKELLNRKKDWWYFYKGDESAADFAYAKYLMNFNLSDEDIKKILLAESKDIQERKKGHLQAYLDLTVSKARAHFVPFGEEN
jgi:hypothetical protein